MRGAGIASSLAGTQSFGKMHVADWLPTLLHAASGDADWFEHHIAANEPPHALGDGIDVWDMFATEGGAPSARTEVLQECHPDGKHIHHGNSLTVGNWKAIKIAKLDGFAVHFDRAVFLRCEGRETCGGEGKDEEGGALAPRGLEAEARPPAGKDKVTYNSMSMAQAGWS